MSATAGFKIAPLSRVPDQHQANLNAAYLLRRVATWEESRETRREVFFMWTMPFWASLAATLVKSRKRISTLSFSFLAMAVRSFFS